MTEERSVAGAACRRRGLASLAADTRGASLLEYLLLVGLAALLAIAGVQRLGRAIDDKASAQAACIAGGGCAEGSVSAIEAPSLSDRIASGRRDAERTEAMSGIQAALRAGFDNSAEARARGTQPRGVQVAAAGDPPVPAGEPPPDLSPPGSGRDGALHEALRRTTVTPSGHPIPGGIPTSSVPVAVGPNVDASGRVQPGRVLVYAVPNPHMPGGVEHVVIRDDSAGHRYRDNPRQNRGPHYNNPAGGHFQYPGGAAPPGNTVIQASNGMRYFVDRMGQIYSMDGRDVVRQVTIRDVPQDVRSRIGGRAMQRIMRSGRIRMPPRGVD